MEDFSFAIFSTVVWLGWRNQKIISNGGEIQFLIKGDAIWHNLNFRASWQLGFREDRLAIVHQQIY